MNKGDQNEAGRSTVAWPLAITVGGIAGLVGAAALFAMDRKLRAPKKLANNSIISANETARFHDLTIDAGDAEETFLVSVQMLRGKIINNFSNDEFMFADLHFRARQLPVYDWLSPNLPYTVKSRIASVEALARADGPIGFYRDELLAVAQEFSRFEKLRQFIAHGNMLVDRRHGEPIIVFHVYDQPRKSLPILSERKKYVT